MEARRFGIGHVDQRLARLAGEIIEADMLEGEAQLGGGALGGARRAGEIARNIDQRNLAADQGRRRRDGEGGRLTHGTDPWLQAATIMGANRRGTEEGQGPGVMPASVSCATMRKVPSPFGFTMAPSPSDSSTAAAALMVGEWPISQVAARRRPFAQASLEPGAGRGELLGRLRRVIEQVGIDLGGAAEGELRRLACAAERARFDGRQGNIRLAQPAADRRGLAAVRCR